MWPFKENIQKIKSIVDLHEEGTQKFDDLIDSSHPIFSSKNIFKEAAREALQKYHQQELELLDDEKLCEYIKDTVKYLVNDLVTNASSVNILVGQVRVPKIPKAAWNTFALIFCKLCKELGIEIASFTGDYIHVDKCSFEKFINSLKEDYIDIDERVRAMLSTGPYR